MVKNRVFIRLNQSIRFSILSVLIMLLLTISAPVSAKTSYVSDQLNVPVRSGATTGHRIIKFLRSGAALTVLGVSDDNKFVEVDLSDGKTGWIEAKDLMDIPSGRDRLAAANKKFANFAETIKDYESTIAELKSEVRQLKKEKSSLQNEGTNLSNSLNDLKITAANPLALSKKNKELKRELDNALDNAEMLDKDNQKLRSNVAQEWFMIGGAVSIGSLILGLILTRINWRRKKNSWGDSF
ncbi:MAG: TIGR04211 family SH3 domain-containing protein [Gammaproteobacteria bacterium]|nr:TIGR04211 family SH3 domain-containing protein [Gammaproteobacteria bacterium]